MLIAAGSENKQQVPLFLPFPGGWRRGQALPSRGCEDRVCPGVGRGRGLGGRPLVCGVELGQAQYPAFVPNFQLLFLALQKWQLGFGGRVVSLGPEFPPAAHAHRFQFHTVASCFITGREACPGASFTAEGPRSQACRIGHRFSNADCLPGTCHVKLCDMPF